MLANNKNGEIEKYPNLHNNKNKSEVDKYSNLHNDKNKYSNLGNNWVISQFVNYLHMFLIIKLITTSYYYVSNWITWVFFKRLNINLIRC